MTIYGYRTEQFAKAAGPELVRALIHALGGTSAPVSKPASTSESKPVEAGASKLVRVSIPFASYDKRANSSPWIATVSDWPEGGKPAYNFLNDAWTGSASDGGAITVDLLPGTVVRYGQKNYRNRSASTLKWGVVERSGYIRTVASKDVARSLWKQSLTSK